MVKNYLNLTAGLEWLHFVNNPNFIRIQSTALEQKRWDHVLITLGTEFLYDLAKGNKVNIYDCGARKPVSRAIYQGIPWIKFALQKSWNLPIDKPMVKHNNVTQYFSDMYKQLSNQIKVELKAYRKYCNGQINLSGTCVAVGKVGIDRATILE